MEMKKNIILSYMKAMNDADNCWFICKMLSASYDISTKKIGIHKCQLWPY